MDFPFGHPHRNNRRDDEDSNNYRPPQYPPPPNYGGTYPPPPSYNRDFPHAPPQTYPPPPPPHVAGVQHVSHTPHIKSPNYPPPPQVAGVHHISHNTPQFDSPNYPPPGPPPPQQPPPYEHHEYGGGGGSHHFKPHMPGFLAGHFHHSSPSYESGGSGDYGVGGVNMNNLEGYFGNKKGYKIYCKAGGNTYCVGIRDKKVVLSYADPNDPTQHWYKDEKYSTKVKDEEGYPSFSLVNKATGQAMKHPISGQPVDLVPYKPDHLDGAVLWTESKDLGSGYRTIRNVNNVKMVLDAFNGDKDHGGVHDGTFLSIFKCWKGDNQNQQWKIFPYYSRFI